MDDNLQKHYELLNCMHFEYCEQNFHSKSTKEDICLDENCEIYKVLSCPLCFDSHNNSHKRYNIKVVLNFIFQNLYEESLKWKTFKQDSELFWDIDVILEKIQSKVEELSKMQQEISQLKQEMETIINSQAEKYSKFYDQFQQNLDNKKEFSRVIEEILTYAEINKNKLIFIDNLSEIKEKEAKIKETIETAKTLIGYENNKNSSSHQNYPNILINSIKKEELANSLKKQEFSFDLSNKAKNILLENNNSQAIKINESNYQQSFVFIAPSLNKTAKITFLIGNCNWLALGVCKLRYIKNMNCNFLYTSEVFQRGYYLISQNGYSWSDTDDKEHSKQNSFKFQTNDQIEVLFDLSNKQIKFQKNKNDTKILSFEPVINDVYVFCAVLHYIDDSLKILN